MQAEGRRQAPGLSLARKRARAGDRDPDRPGGPSARVAQGATSSVASLEAVERDYLLSVLGAKGGKSKLAAISLDIGPATLQRKRKFYGKPSPSLE